MVSFQKLLRQQCLPRMRSACDDDYHFSSMLALSGRQKTARSSLRCRPPVWRISAQYVVNRGKGRVRRSRYSTTLMTEPAPSILAAMASQSGPRKKELELRTASGLLAGTGSDSLSGSPLTTRICPPTTRCHTPLNCLTGSTSNMLFLPAKSRTQAHTAAPEKHAVSAAGGACSSCHPPPCLLRPPGRRARRQA